MKKIIPITFMLFSIGFIFIVFGMKSVNYNEPSISESAIIIEIPKEVQSVIDKSCVACHSSDASNAKAKLNISFDKFKTGDYSIGKVIGKLNNIVEVMDDGSMPPKKFIEKNPEKALNESDTKIVKDWASKTVKKYSEE